MEPTSGAAAGLADRYFERDGIRIHYVEAGSGELVLMLHGFPQFWWLWRAQVEDLGRDHHAVAADMRGYNLSSAPQEVEAYRVEVNSLIREFLENRRSPKVTGR